MKVRLRLRHLGCVMAIAISAQAHCIEEGLLQRTMNSVAWHRFWFGLPETDRLEDTAVLVRTTEKTGILLPRYRVSVVYTDRPAAARGRPFVMQTGVGRRAEDIRSFKSNMTRTNSITGLKPAVLNECTERVGPVSITRPVSQQQRKGEADTRFLAAAKEFAAQQARFVECPCKVWIAATDESESHGFALLSDAKGVLYPISYIWELRQGKLVRIHDVLYEDDWIMRRLESRIKQYSRVTLTFP